MQAVTKKIQSFYGQFSAAGDHGRLGNLRKQNAQLLQFNTLPAVQLEKVQLESGDAISVPKIERQACPGDYHFVQIHAGSTYHYQSLKKETTDAATVAVVDGMLAATVVGAGSSHAIAENSQAYSALITTAALDTVKIAVQEKYLSGTELKRYFFGVIKELEKETEWCGSSSDQKVTVAGIVLFESQGIPKKLVFGLGYAAVAATMPYSIETLHLKGSSPNNRLAYGAPAPVPTLVPGFTSLKGTDLTVEVSDVNPYTTSIQLMTDGCELAFFKTDPTSRLQCHSLPEHGEFNSETLFESANEQVNARALRELTELEEDSSEVDSLELQQLNEKYGKTLGDDVLHLSINIPAAFCYLKTST